MRRKGAFHGLKKVKVRQSMNKYNLYNLSRLSTPHAASKTFFQQKWAAKSMTRAYHGAQIRESQWTRLFQRRMPAVVPMDHVYLGKHDGSELAAGRGSGQDSVLDEWAQDTSGKGRKGEARTKVPKTPYMHMVYHPTERRLDTAVFRALFASSTRQARQFVVHGHVRVNGKKMIYPGYMLNPGDMFTVDPETVLWATGAPKGSPLDADAEPPAQEEAPLGPEEQLELDLEMDEMVSEITSLDLSSSPSAEADAEAASPKSRLKALIKETQTLVSEHKKELSGRRLIELRELYKQARRTLSQPAAQTPDALTAYESTLADIKSRVPFLAASPDASDPPNPSTTPELASLSPSQQRKLTEALTQLEANPIDPTRPYATPWRPRDYMAAFAFIPRYLEVNQNVCAAVYLRHPVARPGLGEVPTPFAGETCQLVFNWYLRRR